MFAAVFGDELCGEFVTCNDNERCCGANDCVLKTKPCPKDETALSVKLAGDEQWPAVLKGVLEGFGVSKTLDEMKDCLASSKSELRDVEDAIELLEKKDAHDVLDGLGKLGSALELLPTTVHDCEAAAKDVKDEAPKLVEALEALKHPKEFAFHVGKDLVVNHAEIFQQVSAAINDYHGQKWEDFGKSVGAALSEILVGSAESLIV